MGTSTKLAWETLDYAGFSKTYNSDYMVSDSASTAFAMYSGVKTAGYTMGFDNTIKRLDLSSEEAATEVDTVLDWAQQAGKKMDIMLGGGRAAWLPRTELRWDYDSDEWNCTRWDGRNLINEWKGNHSGGVYIENKTELMN